MKISNSEIPLTNLQGITQNITNQQSGSVCAHSSKTQNISGGTHSAVDRLSVRFGSASPPRPQLFALANPRLNPTCERGPSIDYCFEAALSVEHLVQQTSDADKRSDQVHTGECSVPLQQPTATSGLEPLTPTSSFPDLFTKRGKLEDVLIGL